MSGGMVGAAHLSANAGNGSASPPWYNFISGMQRSPGSSGAKVAREATKNTIATSPPKIAGQNADARALPWNVSSPAGFFGMDQPHQGPLPSDLAAIANQHKPNTGMMIWDKSLDFMESPLVYGAYWLRDGKKIVTAFSGPIGQMIKGGPGALAGKTALTGALKSLGGGLVAGVIGSLVGQWVGTKAGHWVMGDLLGWNKMAGDGPNPATVGMEIAHTSRWATIGAQVLGAAVALGIGIFMIATGPVGWVAFALIATAAAAAAGGSAFSAAASQYGEPAGQIIEGSPDVFFESRAVACVGHEIACDRHGTGHHLREGSETVFANGRPITRVGHGTTCNGKVNGGVDSVGIDMTTSAIQLPVVADMWDMIGRTALVVCEVASVGYDKWGPRVKPKPPATPPAPEAPTPPPSRPNPVNTPKSPTGTNPGGAGTGTGTPPVVAGAGAAKPAVPVTPSTRPATQPALPPGKPAPLALPAPKTPAALPAAKTPP
ncbi:MAG: PAAR domain-containing protein, partial [Paracoccus sp. (in: a-proteobacteria)]|nr:PAAR domain-containing protein [Paracoccus sp. (in: a-proteobacteria)]